MASLHPQEKVPLLFQKLLNAFVPGSLSKVDPAFRYLIVLGNVTVRDCALVIDVDQIVIVALVWPSLRSFCAFFRRRGDTCLVRQRRADRDVEGDEVRQVQPGRGSDAWQILAVDAWDHHGEAIVQKHAVADHAHIAEGHGHVITAEHGPTGDWDVTAVAVWNSST